MIHKIMALSLAFALLGTCAWGQKSEDPITPYGADQTCNLAPATYLCMPLDESWEVVQFDGASPDCYQNDDLSTTAIPLPFTFDLFGSPHTSLWINNNGNLSFDGPYGTFTPEGFPVAGYPMVAPFWADVDTRSMESGAGTVWMKMGPNYLAVTWDHVGYFSTHTDLQNTFQVIISDGTFGPMGLGNNVCFCYGDMQWTTGDASGGVGGFGGAPATVGVNKGDGVDYFNVGRFDHAGSDYAGPGGISGVDWLDYQHMCFNVSAETNQPPVPVNFPAGNMATAYVGQQLDLTVGFIGPEAGQTVHTEVDPAGLANFSYISTDGNPSTVQMSFTPTAAQLGVHVIHFTASDNYNPAGVTEVDLEIVVEYATPTEETSWGALKNHFR